MIVNGSHVAYFQRSQQDHSRTDIVILWLALVRRWRNQSLIPRDDLVVVEANDRISTFLLSVHVRVFRVCYLGVNGLEGSFDVQLVKLNKLSINLDVWVFILREERCGLELLS